MSVYEFNPKLRPDSAFEPGALHHLTVGRAGRLLDPRRTPVTIVAVRADVGMFTVRLDDFEDKGAMWDVPIEDVEHYQFELSGPAASDAFIAQYRDAIERLNRTCNIECEQEATATTLARIKTATATARNWLRVHSSFIREGGTLPHPQRRLGDPRLAIDLLAYMDQHDLHEIERAFAAQYARNPNAGEIVKGHRIVIAELGLVPYEGKIVRDLLTFEAAWTKERRAAHILARLGFMRALFGVLGIQHVTLHRGLATNVQLRAPGNDTFISASFDRAVAESHFNAHGEFACRALFAQRVPIERLFMTYHETAAMNEHYREAEAVLFRDPGNAAF